MSCLATPSVGICPRSAITRSPVLSSIPQGTSFFVDLPDALIEPRLPPFYYSSSRGMMGDDGDEGEL